MFKFIKNSTMFVVGLGASVILGRWLKKREEESAANQTKNTTTSAVKAQPKKADNSAEVQEIPLPPSAFEGLEKNEASKSSANGASKPKAEATPKSEVKPKAEPTVETSTASEPDDLTQINGIGAKTAETLQAMGIATFADLAKADANTIKDQVARVSLEKIEAWIDDAKKRSTA